jgi:hypothetical protein
MMHRIRLVTAALLSKSLLYALLCLGLGSFLIWALSFDSSDYIELAFTGHGAVAEIVDYAPEQRRGRRGRVRTVHYHRIVYEGHSGKIDLDERRPVGEKLYVVYKPNRPSFVRLGKEGESPLGILWANMGWTLLFVIGIAGVMFYTTYLHMTDFFKGESGDFLRAAFRRKSAT